MSGLQWRLPLPVREMRRTLSDGASPLLPCTAALIAKAVLQQCATFERAIQTLLHVPRGLALPLIGDGKPTPADLLAERFVLVDTLLQSLAVSDRPLNKDTVAGSFSGREPVLQRLLDQVSQARATRLQHERDTARADGSSLHVTVPPALQGILFYDDSCAASAGVTFDSPAARYIATKIINSAEHQARRDLVQAWLQWQDVVDKECAPDAAGRGRRGSGSSTTAIDRVFLTTLCDSRVSRSQGIQKAAEALRAAKERMA